MTWLEEIIGAFEKLGEDVHYRELYNYIGSDTNRNLPNSWKQVIRRVIQQHSSDTQSFQNGMDVFYSTRGLGKGYWALRQTKMEIISSAPDMGAIQDLSPPERVKTQIYRVLRDSRLSRQLKLLYRNKCQICGHVIVSGDFHYSEAHHLQPLGNPHNGVDGFKNMMILCPNHHVEFDYGLIAIDPSTMIVIHKNVNNEFNGCKLILEEAHIIDRHFLEYHLNEIFKEKGS